MRPIKRETLRSEQTAEALDSDIDTFKATFGSGDNHLAVEDSEFDLLDADGGSGANTFDDRGGNEFETLRLRRFVRV